MSSYIFIWSLIIGAISYAITYAVKSLSSPKRSLITAITASIGVIIWNYLIIINNISQYLNVDIPFRLFPISFADAGDSVLVFALTSLILGISVDQNTPAIKVVIAALIAAIVTLLADVYCF